MAETPEPGDREDPFAPGLLLEQRLRALESAWAQPRSGQTDADLRTSGQATCLESLAAELAACRTQMRDQEKAMVERIADVDDDRRLTGAQLQRGWQAQRDEFEARLRRGAGRMVLALGLVLALVGGGLYALYSQVMGARATQAHQVETLRQEVQRLAAVERPDAQVQDRLATLSAAVDQLSTAVGELKDRQHQSPLAAGPDGSPLAGDIARLAAGEEHLTGELESLKRALESLVSTLPPQSALAAVGQGTRLSAAPDTAAEPPLRGPPVGVAPTAPQSALPPRGPGESASAGPAADPAADEQVQTIAVTDRPFALQLIGSYSRAQILAHAARANLPGPAYLHQETRRGRPWFVLIYSLHGSGAQARAAIAQLPPGLRTPAPWVRTLPVGTRLEVVTTGRAP